MIRNIKSGPAMAAVRSGMSTHAATWVAGLMLMATSTTFALHAPVDVVLDRTAVPPGGTATIAIAFKLDPGWHVYWQNPGAAGAPPKVKWTLPAGVTVGELQFPVPKFKMLGDLAAYVYEDEVAFLADVTVPPDATRAVELKGHLKVVVCEEACVLEEQDVAVHIPIGPGEAHAADRFAAWRAAQPIRQTPLRTIAAMVDPDGQHGRLRIELPPGLSGQAFFPPRTRFLKFDDKVGQSAGNKTTPDAYTIGFRVLSDPPAEFSGPGLIVLQDATGKKASAEEVQFTFKFAKP